MKVFYRRVLIKRILIFLIIFLVIRKRIFLVFDIISFSSKGFPERISIEIFILLVSWWVKTREYPLVMKSICVFVYDLKWVVKRRLILLLYLI